MLAGVSADYYIRLEQGRDQHPSAQVLAALARALQLDENATAHLHGLAQPPTRRRRRNSRPERAPAAITQLIMSWPTTPAYVFGRYLDVLAANPLASALAPWFTVGENLVRSAFLDPRRREPELLTADAKPKGSGTSVMHHPQVGRLELSYTKLPIPDTDRQTLSMYHAAPDSPSQRALALLATTTVPEREPERTLRD